MKVARYKIYVALFFILSYVVWISIYLLYENRNNVKNFEITVLAWTGIVIVLAYVIYWRRLTGKYFTLFNIFNAFFVVFNFGQCVLWAVGIHTEKEIGQKLVYSRVMADNNLIARAQLLFIIAFISINAGALLVWSCQKKKESVLLKNNEVKKDIRYSSLYYTSLILAFLSIPTTLYKTIYRFILGQRYSYRALHYGEAALLLDNNFINIVSLLFFPSLLGLLIGSGYKRNVRVGVYFVFAIYAVISLLVGDRGEWIGFLILFFWADYHYYKRLSAKKMLLLICGGFIALNIMNAIVALRNSGLSWSGFVNNLFMEDNNSVVSLLTEFGNSMGIVIILLDTGVGSWYGNTYIMSFVTMFGTSIANRILGTNYVQLHTWFPMEFLKISYGTDFSIIGEAVLNVGVFFMPLVLLVEGIIIGWISQWTNTKDSSPLSICLSISIMTSVIKIVRSTVWMTLHSICYVIIIFLLLNYFVNFWVRKSIG